MTNKRVLKIDTQGLAEKKVEYLTILWAAIKGFSGEELRLDHSFRHQYRHSCYLPFSIIAPVETAGNILDRDSELTLYVNLPNVPCLQEGLPRNSRTRIVTDFRDGRADLFAGKQEPLSFP